MKTLNTSFSIRYTLLFFLLFLPLLIKAQQYTITGGVYSVAGEPIPYTTVQISNSDSTIVSGCYTNPQGEFSLNVEHKGTYYLSFSSIGFVTHSQTITIPQNNILHITLTEENTQLADVVITERKKLITITTLGTVVYNMARDKATSNEDLLTAMRRVPMVTVDGKGGLQVKGSRNFSVYLNGKPFRSATQNPTEVLASIPATSVEKVEIITNPDASFETDSGSIIINIITNRKKLDGYNIRTSLEATTLPGINALLSMILVKGKFKLSTIYNYQLDAQKGQTLGLRRDVKHNNSKSEFATTSEVGGKTHLNIGRVLAEYEIDSLNTIYADVHINSLLINSLLKGTQAFSLNNETQRNINISNRTKTNEAALESNLLFRHLTKNNINKLTLGYRFSYSPDVRNYEVSTEQNGEWHYIKNQSNGGLQEHTFNGDILLFNNSAFTIKGGVLDVLRYAKANPYYYSKNNVKDNWKRHEVEGRNKLVQWFNAIASYINVSYEWRNIALNVGSRAEYTTSQITLEHNRPSIKTKYFNIVPRASLSLSPTKTSQISLSYYYGIIRPSIWSINPFWEQKDDYNVSFGNHKLRYASENALSLGIMFYGNKYFTNITADYKYTKHPIISHYWIEGNNTKTLFNSFINGTSEQILKLSSMMNYRPTNWVSFNIYGDVAKYRFEQTKEDTKVALSYNVYSSIDVTLPYNIYLGIMYSYMHQPPIFQVYYGHDHNYSLYATKSFFNNFFNVTLVTQCPFKKHIKFTETIEGNDFKQYRWNNIKAFYVGLKLTLNFNNGEKVKLERNLSLKQNDLDHATGVQ